MRSLDPDIARVEREGIAAFDAVPLEGLQEEAVMATSPNFYNVSRPVALKPTLVVE